MHWSGVMPAITTPFRADLSLDATALEAHAAWLVEHGVTALVPLGSLGESATLSFAEKIEVLRTVLRAVDGRVPVVAGIAALSTAECVDLAQKAAEIGCRGLMVLPPYVYRPDARELRAHFDAVLDATPLSTMLYNNPIAYGVDYLPADVIQLAEVHPNLRAVKESSGDVRRIATLKGLAGDRLAIFAGIDDLVYECAVMGATGWIAGLVNAFPAESVALFRALERRDLDRASELYGWFLPLLRLDAVPKFVQLVKLVQAEMGYGHERLRPPRLEVVGEEREHALGVLKQAIATRPAL